MVRIVLLGAASSMATALFACATQPSAPSAVAADAGNADAAPDDAGPLACPPSWLPFDASRSCTLPAAPATGVCASATSSHKGLYFLCAVSPTHEFFVTNVGIDARITGDGWTFGPNDGIARQLGLPPVSDADNQTCTSAASSGPLPPECAAADGG